MNDRNKFYKQDCSTPLPNEIEWYDVFWGLIQKDKELNQGDNVSVIIHEFEETGYPTQDITF
jgi:hypothetical protein